MVTKLESFDQPSKSAFARDAVPTNNPHEGLKVTCFRDGNQKWMYVDDTNITLYSAAKARLLELGVDPSEWEYTEEGRMYSLPGPLLFAWQQRTSEKSGRPYKECVGIQPAGAEGEASSAKVLAALSMAFEETPALELVPRPAPDLLPEVAEAPEEELRRIAPLLGAANRAIDDLGAKARELEQAAMDAVRAANPVLYERLDAQTAKRDELTTKARKLLELHREASGETGRVLNGWYTITRSETTVMKPRVSEAHLIGWLIRNAVLLLRRGILKVDYDVLHELTVSKKDDPGLYSAFRDMPVVLENVTKYGSRIEWSKLPELVAEDAPVSAQEPVNGHKESAGEPSPERFPAE